MTCIRSILLVTCLCAAYLSSSATAESKIILKGHPPIAPEVSLRWSPSGRHVACTGLPLEEDQASSCLAGLLIADVKSATALLLSDEMGAFAWDQGGTSLVQVLQLGPLGTARLFRIRPSTGEMKPLADLPKLPDACEYSPGGKYFGFTLDGQIYFVPLIAETKTSVKKIEVGQGTLSDGLVWVGTDNLMTMTEKGLCLVNRTTNSCVPIPVPLGFKPLDDPRYWAGSDSADRILLVADDQTTHSSALILLSKQGESWVHRVLALMPERLFAFPTFSPDGRYVAYVETGPHGEGVASLRVLSATGGKPRVVAGDYGGAWSSRGYDWSPDSSELAYIDVHNIINVVSAR